MEKYVYLLCSPHSGSTLLAFLLGNHPQIATVGELAGRTDYNNYKCSCGELITQCCFWRSIKKKVEKKGAELDLTNFDIFIDGRRQFSRFDRLFDFYSPFSLIDSVKCRLFLMNGKRKKWLGSTVRKNILLAETITETMNKRVFFDTTKDFYRLRHLKEQLGDKVKVIFLTRDGRGVVNSLISRENIDEKQAVKSWVWSNKTILRIIKNYFPGDQSYQLKYETLCGDIEGELKGILSFLGEADSFDIKTFKKEEFHIIGNFMRKDFKGNILLDEKWRRELSESQLDAFDRDAGKLNASLGYGL